MTDFVHLRAAGVSLLLDTRGTAVPAVLHWGRDLGDRAPTELAAAAAALVPGIPPSALDEPVRVSLLPTLRDGWTGRQALELFVPAGPLAAQWETTGTRVDEHGARIALIDAASRVTVEIELELSDEGVLRIRHHVQNGSGGPLGLGSVGSVIPIPDRAREVLDYTGRWGHERQPQRSLPGHGLWSRASRHGRPGHDNAYLVIAGTPGFAFRTGEVWAAHLAWSGDGEHWYERSPLGATLLGGGELLAPGELRLEPGEEYVSPWLVLVYSASGIDGVRGVLIVDQDRIQGCSRSDTPRPLTLNTWEAVYFDHSESGLAPLVDAAARVGVERFVLDDGWFRGRSDDHRALGDWFVDTGKWPDGLGPLIDRVQDAGMEFGLWVEPEMVNRDSDVAREHPDWILQPASSPTWRWQNTFDLAQPAVFDYVFARIDALLAEYPIAYLKWDHNRDLLVPDAHRQTEALYRLIDAVRAAHPGVEIESCASGGGRIDLGILPRVDRVWTSDTNDPRERQVIQRGTSVLVPLEYIGSHVGAARAHTTHRTATLGFRLATALFASAGIEWDLLQASKSELKVIAEWATTYREYRDLLHHGVLVHGDQADPAQLVQGVVSASRDRALYSYALLDSSESAPAAAVSLPGLDPDRVYRVRPVALGEVATVQHSASPWWPNEVVLTGRVLSELGIAMPMLAPENAVVLAVDEVR